jgi:hypothetical protein
MAARARKQGLDRLGAGEGEGDGRAMTSRTLHMVLRSRRRSCERQPQHAHTMRVM